MAVSFAKAGDVPQPQHMNQHTISQSYSVISHPPRSGLVQRIRSDLNMGFPQKFSRWTSQKIIIVFFSASILKQFPAAQQGTNACSRKQGSLWDTSPLSAQVLHSKLALLVRHESRSALHGSARTYLKLLNPLWIASYLNNLRFALRSRTALSVNFSLLVQAIFRTKP